MIVKNKATKETIGLANNGQRLDNFLMSYIKNTPRSHVYKLIRTGQVRVNSSRAKASTKLNVKDIVRIPPYTTSEQLKPTISQEMIDKTLESIVYEDEDIIVFNKPSSFAVHSGTNIGYGLIDIMRLVRSDCERVDLLHRLDKDTSGCIIITKNFRALKYFTSQIDNNKLEKKYICLVDGLWDPAVKDNAVDLVRNNKTSKAISKFNIIKLYKNSTLLEVNIITGRYHQIRKHCAMLDHPVIGDDRYGNWDINKIYKKNGLNRIFLHSSSIGFHLPDQNTIKKVECNLTKDLEKFLKSHQ